MSNYYDKKRMSATTFKRYLTCPSAAYHNPKLEPTAAMQIGSKVDDGLLLGSYEPILTAKTKKPSADNKKIDTWIAKAKSNNLFMSYLEGDKQSEFEFEIDGVPWKAKLDILNSSLDRVVDLKTSKDLKGGWSDELSAFVNPWVLWRYDLQLAVYCYAAKVSRAFLAIISKTDDDLAIVECPEYVLQSALNKIIEKNKEVWDQYQGNNLWRCGKCSHCIETRTEEEMIKQWE